MREDVALSPSVTDASLCGERPEAETLMWVTKLGAFADAALQRALNGPRVLWIAAENAVCR